MDKTKPAPVQNKAPAQPETTQPASKTKKILYGIFGVLILVGLVVGGFMFLGEGTQAGKATFLDVGCSKVSADSGSTNVSLDTCKSTFTTLETTALIDGVKFKVGYTKTAKGLEVSIFGPSDNVKTSDPITTFGPITKDYHQAKDVYAYIISVKGTDTKVEITDVAQTINTCHTAKGSTLPLTFDVSKCPSYDNWLKSNAKIKDQQLTFRYKKEGDKGLLQVVTWDADDLGNINIRAKTKPLGDTDTQILEFIKQKVFVKYEKGAFTVVDLNDISKKPCAKITNDGKLPLTVDISSCVPYSIWEKSSFEANNKKHYLTFKQGSEGYFIFNLAESEGMKEGDANFSTDSVLTGSEKILDYIEYQLKLVHKADTLTISEIKHCAKFTKSDTSLIIDTTKCTFTPDAPIYQNKFKSTSFLVGKQKYYAHFYIEKGSEGSVHFTTSDTPSTTPLASTNTLKYGESKVVSVDKTKLKVSLDKGIFTINAASKTDCAIGDVVADLGCTCKLPLKETTGLCSDPNDPDLDGLVKDNCPNHVNPFQEDFDGDGKGDACDADSYCTVMYKNLVEFKGSICEQRYDESKIQYNLKSYNCEGIYEGVPILRGGNLIMGVSGKSGSALVVNGSACPKTKGPGEINTTNLNDVQSCITESVGKSLYKDYLPMHKKECSQKACHEPPKSTTLPLSVDLSKCSGEISPGLITASVNGKNYLFNYSQEKGKDVTILYTNDTTQKLFYGALSLNANGEKTNFTYEGVTFGLEYTKTKLTILEHIDTKQFCNTKEATPKVLSDQPNVCRKRITHSKMNLAHDYTYTDTCAGVYRGVTLAVNPKGGIAVFNGFSGSHPLLIPIEIEGNCEKEIGTFGYYQNKNISSVVVDGKKVAGDYAAATYCIRANAKYNNNNWQYMQGCSNDSDNDGVDDEDDKCADTKVGVKVSSNGCPIGDSDGDGTLSAKNVQDYWEKIKGALLMKGI